MEKAVFEGFILSINKVEGAQIGALVHVDFVLLVRCCSMDLHKHVESKNYWKPYKFCCSARAPYKLQNAFVRLDVGNYVTVTAEKGEHDWRVTDISFVTDEAQDFRELIAHNEGIL